MKLCSTHPNYVETASLIYRTKKSPINYNSVIKTLDFKSQFIAMLKITYFNFIGVFSLNFAYEMFDLFLFAHKF